MTRRQTLQTALAASLHNALDWWVAEVSALAPALLRRLVRSSAPPLLVWSDDSPQLWPSGSRDAACPVDVAPGGLPDALGGTTRVILALPAAMAIVRDLQLPAAAAGRLHTVVGFELDRLTPFEASELAYTARQMSNVNPQGKIAVRLYALPQRVLAPAIQWCQSRGIGVDRIDLVAEQPPATLGIALPHPAVGRRKTGLSGFLVAGGLVLAVVALLSAFAVRQGRQLDQLEQRLQAMRSVKQGTGLESGLDVSVLPPPVAILTLLDTLTAQVPDGNWLDELHYEDALLSIAGVAPDPAALATRLEQHPGFTDVRFTEAMVPAPDGSGARFRLEMKTATDQRR